MRQPGVEPGAQANFLINGKLICYRYTTSAISWQANLGGHNQAIQYLVHELQYNVAGCSVVYASYVHITYATPHQPSPSSSSDGVLVGKINNHWLINATNW